MLPSFHLLFIFLFLGHIFLPLISSINLRANVHRCQLIHNLFLSFQTNKNIFLSVSDSLSLSHSLSHTFSPLTISSHFLNCFLPHSLSLTFSFLAVLKPFRSMFYMSLAFAFSLSFLNMSLPFSSSAYQQDRTLIENS